MKSIWQASVEMPKFDNLYGDISTDVAIVGGGIAGLLTAYFLKERGIDCVVIEKDRICSKTTANTTGKITAGQGLIYHKVAKRYGRECAEGFYLVNARAIDNYISMGKKYRCDMEIKDNYIYSHLDRPAVEREVRLLDSFSAPAEFVDSIPLPLEIAGSVRLRNQAQFNPLQFLLQIAKELKIYENTFVKEIKDGKILSDRGRVRAENTVIATHFPIIDTKGAYFLKLYQHRSYLLALENAPDIGGMYLNEGEDGVSFRNYGSYILIGGGGHRTGKTGGGYDAVRRVASELFPDARETYSFGAQDCISLDGMPYIGSYSKKADRLFVATGFNKWGMCGSMVAAELISDMISGRRNDYVEIFSPERSILHPQLFLNAAETTCNLLFPTTKRCSHLGCALHYNKAEHSWDCACHGSRFSDEGRVIDNPAQRDINL